MINKARRMPIEGGNFDAPAGGTCKMALVECGINAGDSVTVGKYPDGDFVIGTVVGGHAGTIILSPETMRELVQIIGGMLK